MSTGSKTNSENFSFGEDRRVRYKGSKAELRPERQKIILIHCIIEFLNYNFLQEELGDFWRYLCIFCVYFQIPVLHISPALSSSFSSLDEATGYSPESLYDYYGLTTPHYQHSTPRFAFQNGSPYLPWPSLENFDELNCPSSADPQSICSFDFLDIAGTKIDVDACEDENHSTSAFEMMESHCVESIGNLNNIFEADDDIDECIKNIVKSNFYREFSYADWLHRLANLLAHIWEELDNNAKLYGDIISYEAQYGNRIYNLARIYVHAVQLFKNFTAKAIKIIFYFYFIIMDNINS